MKQWLAKCGKCGENFVPVDEEDLEHGETEMGDECGGQGEMLGYFTPPKVYFPDVVYSPR